MSGQEVASPRRTPPRSVVLGALVVLTAVAVLSYLLGSTRIEDEPAALPTPSPTESPTPPTTSEIAGTVAASVVVLRTAEGQGAGVVVNASGGILTALHVVDGTDPIQVTFADGTKSSATVASSDAAQDVAMLTAQRLPTVVVPAVIGGGVKVGDDVLAIGSPLGLPWSVSKGIVSALDRSTEGEGGVELEGLIQFDAAVNPGSSGGPLVNAAGGVVGIVIALVASGADSDDRSFVGIGFAVPIGVAIGGGPGDDGPDL